MPLSKGKGKEAVSKNISKMMHEGEERSRAIAIALSTAGKSKRKVGK